MNTKIYATKFIPAIFTKSKTLATHKFDSVYDIDFTKFDNLKVIIFDFDDTLVGHYDLPDQKMNTWLKGLISKGYNLAVYSNCPPARNAQIQKILDELGIYNVEQSRKPGREGYEEVLNHFKAKPEETMMVGERLGTDIFGAFFSNIKYRVLVKPYSEVVGGSKAPFFHRIVRNIELLFV